MLGLSLAEKIDKHVTDEARLVEIRNELSALDTQLADLDRKRGGLRSSIAALKNDLVRQVPLKSAPRTLDKRRLADYEQRLQTAEADRVSAQAQHDALAKEQNALTVRLNKAAVGLKDLTALSGARDKAQAEIDRLKGLIDEQERLAAAVDDSAVKAAAAERQNVLAAIAAGESDERALRDVDAALARAQRELAKVTEGATRSADTVSGLRARFAVVQQGLDEITRRADRLLAMFLYSQAVVIDGDYVKHAEAMARAYTRLVALDRVYRHVKGDEAGFIRDDLILPAAALPASQSAAGDQGELRFADYDALGEAFASLRVQLAEHGIDIPG